MEHQIFAILLYAAIIALVILFLSISFYLLREISIKKKEIKLKEYEVNISTAVEKDTFGLLDTIIQETFNEYLVLNIEYRDDIAYIDAELEKIITQDVAHLVIDRISVAVVSKISLVYNINKLDSLISSRVYLCVLNYTISKNTIQEKK